MTDSDLLRVHHVGGRGGDRRFPRLDAFEADIINVLYDGDPDAVDGMADSTDKLTSRQVLLSYCLGARPGRDKLGILRLSAGSSLLPVVPGFFETFSALGSINFDMGAADFSVDREIEVEITTLDHCVYDNAVPAPDFLSINTQGTELDILRGGARTLKDHALAIQCEVTFFDLYRGQNGLDDLCRHLHGHGYWLCTLIPHTPYVPSFNADDGHLIAPPIGFRRGGICLQAEAIFFKDPRRILADHARAHVDLAKAVYIAIVLGNYAMAYAYAAVADVTAIPETWSHLRFGRAFIAAAQQEPRVPVPEVRALNAGTKAVADWYARSGARAALDREASKLGETAYSRTEEVCVSFGFNEAADRLREYRVAAISDILMRLDAKA
jgi:FkbM family methyltransferase